jgi:pilus assembly protein CpaB
MNPRQRQGLLLVLIAAAGLLGVFLLIANYVSSVSKQVGPKSQVLVLIRPLPAYEPVTASMLGEVSVPQKWAPPDALQAAGDALGLESDVALPAGTDLEQGMLTPQPALQPGYREIAIEVDAETGVAGQITPGSLVDIIATYGGGSVSARSSAQVVVADAKVLGVGQLTGGSGSSAASGGDVPVTFSLSPQDVLKVSYAESFASKVRLSLVAPGPSTPPAALPPYSPSP